MEKVIEKIQGLYKELVDTKVEVSSIKVKLEELYANTKGKEEKADLLLADLNEREKKIVSIENVVALSAETNKAIKKLGEDKAVLSTERKAFEDYQEIFKQDREKELARLANAVKKAEDKESEYNEKLRQLTIDKKNLVENVMKDLQKKVN